MLTTMGDLPAKKRRVRRPLVTKNVPSGDYGGGMTHH